MTYTIYADILFMLNFTIDFICMYITLYICRLKRKIIPITISSVLGGIYALCALFLDSKPALFKIAVHILSLIIICSVSTPAKDSKTVLKTTSVFLGVSALGGGLTTAVFSQAGKYTYIGGGIYADISPISLILIVLIFSFLSVPFFLNARKRISLKTARISVLFENGTETFDALIDSGNLLTDPVSGDGIILIKHSVLKEIFCAKQLTAIKKLDVLSEDFPSGIRLVSSDRGLIPVIRPKNTEIKIFGKKGKKEVAALLGIDFSSGTYGGAPGLVPSVYIE